MHVQLPNDLTRRYSLCNDSAENHRYRCTTNTSRMMAKKFDR